MALDRTLFMWTQCYKTGMQSIIERTELNMHKTKQSNERRWPSIALFRLSKTPREVSEGLQAL